MVRDLGVEVTDVSGPIAALAVTGELNLYTSGTFRAAVRNAADDGHPHLILDLAGVPFCDSSGLSSLIMLHRWAGENDGSLTLAAVPDRLARLLQVSGVDQTMTVHPTACEALARHPDRTEHPSTPRGQA